MNRFRSLYQYHYTFHDVSHGNTKRGIECDSTLDRWG